MTSKSLIVASLALVLGPGAACASRAPATVAPPPPAPPSDLIVLMPDPDDGHLGRATVNAAGGSVELNTPRAATRVAPGQAPASPAPINEEELQRIFGEALSARPLPPRQFLLYFETGDTLTVESQALMAQIVEVVRGRSTADATVIGHTDTTGNAASNAALGLRRALLVRTQLLAAGLRDDQIDATSHGEADLLVPTADNVAEPRNRRVEVTVR